MRQFKTNKYKYNNKKKEQINIVYHTKKKINLFVFLCLLLVLIPMFSYSQNTAEKDFEFIRYLLGNNMKEEAQTWAKRDFLDRDYLPQSLDTINFLRGWVFYSNRSLDQAVDLFDRVGEESYFKSSSVFFSSLSNAYKGEYERSYYNLKKYEDLLAPYSELYAFEQAGYSLLMRDFDLYEKYRESFSYSSYILSSKERELDSVFHSLKNYKRKSPLLSACLSAIVPGLGKIYAGSLGEGVSSFITVGSFALIITENWIRHGLENWKTILFGTIGSIFYIGNIYGSYISVKLNYDTFNEKQNFSILSIGIESSKIFLGDAFKKIIFNLQIFSFS